ncbi:MAG TPA: DNA polymerase IV [Pseudogracilibacillus sp.]|nr:DNA polymerase IV [Pseudogracilibacillus sp.]
MSKAKVIFHVDMNSFYASVEMAYNPSLKGKPIAIAGNPEQRKGIVVTSSYEARAEGVKTTMPLWEAKKLCPSLIVIRPNFERYREVSAKIFRILTEMTDLVEPISIDEGFMDVTDTQHHPVDIAHELQRTLLERLDIPCSIGIGPNKFLAKTASDMKKPLGITILRKRNIEEKLWPLPVEEMYGVGAKTAEKLRKMNITTIGELAQTDSYTLAQLLGVNGERLIQRANGHDNRVIDPDSVHDFKSIGNSETLPEDVTDVTEVKNVLSRLSEKVADRLERRKLAGKSVQLMIRFNDRTTITRSRKLESFISALEDILLVAFDLLEEHWDGTSIRLLGVTMSDLLEKDEVLEQLSLFTYEQTLKKSKRDETLDKLKEKYGKETFPNLVQEEHTAPKKLLSTSFQKDFLDDFKTK